MLTIGISISRDRIDAVALEGTGTSVQVAAVAERGCTEPFGDAGDAAALAEQLRAALAGKALPGAVVSLPPPLTFLRPVTLPVHDLTAWELRQHGVPHTVVADNAGGHLMQRGQVDLVVVGADRVSRAGDVCNKIGTYLKALAAFDSGVPFYAAVPSPTIDWELADALREIPIEERAADEVRVVSGRGSSGHPTQVTIADASTPVANPAFDVTPARLVTGIITEAASRGRPDWPRCSPAHTA